MGVEALAESLGQNILTTTLGKLIGWGRGNSVWPLQFGLACCAIEMIHTATASVDIARFGSEAMRASPRQADMMIVSGRVSQKMAPILRTIYDQMPEPKWVISMGACASTGGVFNNYALLQGVDKIVPVDVYIPGCPPRPESLIDAVMLIQQKIKRNERNTKLYDRTRHPLDFEPVALVSNAAEAPPQLTGSRHSLPEKDRSLQEDLFGPPEREVKHVGHIGTREVGTKQV